MKIVSNCTAVAASLSAAYKTYRDYRPSSSAPLEQFLDDNGVLVTMCMRFRGGVPWLACSRKEGDSKLSASWIQAKKTRGFRVIGPPIDNGLPVGLVLKPSTTRVRCLYPADGGTDSRDNNGCGVPTQDPQYGSKGYDHLDWFGKTMARETIVAYKDSAFGTNRTWESIPCSEFLTPASPPPNVTVNSLAAIGFVENNITTESGYEWRYQTQLQVVIAQGSYIMGHPICNTSQPAPYPDFAASNTSTMVLIYGGLEVWHPKDWPVVVELMEQTLDLHPLVETFNELVLVVPPAQQDFIDQSVQAVFYIKGNGLVADEIAHAVAYRESKKMRKPLLYVDSAGNENEDLFHCSKRYDEDREQLSIH